MESDQYDMPRERLLYASSDQPNINQDVWSNLKKKLKGKGYKGLLPLIVCTLYTIHNALRKETCVGGLGDMAKQLAFDLHA